MTMRYAEPIVIPLDLEGEQRVQAAGRRSIAGMAEEDVAVEYLLHLESLDEAVTVAYGELRGCVHLVAQVGGTDFPQMDLTVNVLLHPEQLIVKMNDPPGFMAVELLTAWP